MTFIKCPHRAASFAATVWRLEGGGGDKPLSHLPGAAAHRRDGGILRDSLAADHQGSYPLVMTGFEELFSFQVVLFRIRCDKKRLQIS